MRTSWLCIAGALVTAICPAKAADIMTPGETESTAKAVERGKMIYRYDQAALHTTDTMLAELKQTELKTVRGWVVTPTPNSLLVTYYRFDGDEPMAVYSAQYDGKAVIARRNFAGEADRTLPASSVQLVRAQQQARAMISDLLKAKQMFVCSKARFNEVVLPPTDQGGPISVYFLTPQTQNDVIPLGGHYRFDIRDGQKTAWRAFSKSCLNLAKPKQGGSMEALFVTHLLDPHPTEIHVFESLAARVPILVGLVPQKSIWGVAGDRVTLEKRNFEEAK